MFLLLKPAQAIEYQLPSDDTRVVGEIIKHTVLKGDYFQEIAQQYNVGFLALMDANPDIDPLLPEPGLEIIIPSKLILPYSVHQGIVINLAELRLYYYDKKNETVNVFPIGIGKIGQATPTFNSEITEKRTNPNWFPTKSKREEYLAEHGVEMPRMIKAGPNNPLGDYAMRIGQSVFLIHGTNQRFGIGMRASGGCIRMNPEDIEWLFKKSPPGTPVKIIDQPIKMAYQQDQTRLIEIHSPLTNNEGVTPSLLPLSDAVKKFVDNDPNNIKLIETLAQKPYGLPVKIH